MEFPVTDSKRAMLMDVHFLSKVLVPGHENTLSITDVFRIHETTIYIYISLLSYPNHTNCDLCVKTLPLILGQETYICVFTLFLHRKRDYSSD